ncbi:hypothetical protein BTJ40_00640 [Microbulbifer sp. A4B17]|uniref:glycosyltransferase family 2 protein n=1 Tax=Microbulbifer sp. A4B17 TaxID=359370 RepID=UPI000D52B835|nr:glycosyltransferase family A protein [Microbulbifer sp. A4B17]AWF79452.1 hypothetical protein BTJ40_00640 [Microbulbifer sp. A4B17]
MPDCQVGVVIPTFNEQEKIVNTLSSIIRDNRVSVKIYLSDDNSSDGTVASATDFLKSSNTPHQLFLNDCDRGAGICRNRALDQIAEPLILFFDADDVIIPGTLDRAVAIATKIDSDVLLMAYQCRFPGEKINLGMAGDDHSIFYRSHNTFGNGLFSALDFDAILLLTPYPWNKLIKTSYAKSISLRFSPTPVHNDVLAHWNLLVNARNLALFKSPFCIHYIYSTESRLSNVSDGRRTSILQVFDELEAFFNKNLNARERFYHLYIKFKLGLFNWCCRNLSEEYRANFKVNFSRSFLSLTCMDYRMLFERDPDIANAVLEYRTSVVCV